MFAQGSLLPPGCLNMLTNEGFCCFAVTVLYFAFSALTLLVGRQGVRESYARYIDAARGRALCNDMVSARLSVPSTTCGGFAAVGPAIRRSIDCYSRQRRTAANASSVMYSADVGC